MGPGGDPVVAPSVREVALESNQEALEFVHKLRDGHIDIVIFMTGVGVRALARVVESICPQSQLANLLNQVTIVARGPKPVAALREMAVRVSLSVPEPNTWRDLLRMLDERKDTSPLQGCRIAVQEYGVSNPELLAGLEQRGARVFPVCVYQWALPEDTGPLQAVVTSIIRGEVHALLVASSIQIRHLFQVAESMACASALHDALAQVVIASIGPLTSEELRSRVRPRSLIRCRLRKITASEGLPVHDESLRGRHCLHPRDCSRMTGYSSTIRLRGCGQMAVIVRVICLLLERRCG